MIEKIAIHTEKTKGRVHKGAIEKRDKEQIYTILS